MVTRKRRVPPGGEWVLLATRLTARSWAAAVYTALGEPVASAIDRRRDGAARAALEEALGRARPVRVHADGDAGVLDDLGIERVPLGDEHEELVARFAEDVAAWRLDPDAR